MNVVHLNGMNQTVIKEPRAWGKSGKQPFHITNHDAKERIKGSDINT